MYTTIAALIGAAMIVLQSVVFSLYYLEKFVDQEVKQEYVIPILPVIEPEGGEHGEP
jgi:hypothetical protein